MSGITGWFTLTTPLHEDDPSMQNWLATNVKFPKWQLGADAH